MSSSTTQHIWKSCVNCLFGLITLFFCNSAQSAELVEYGDKASLIKILSNGGAKCQEAEDGSMCLFRFLGESSTVVTFTVRSAKRPNKDGHIVAGLGLSIEPFKFPSDPALAKKYSYVARLIPLGSSTLFEKFGEVTDLTDFCLTNDLKSAVNVTDCAARITDDSFEPLSNVTSKFQEGTFMTIQIFGDRFLQLQLAQIDGT